MVWGLRDGLGTRVEPAISNGYAGNIRTAETSPRVENHVHPRLEAGLESIAGYHARESGGRPRPMGADAVQADQNRPTISNLSARPYEISAALGCDRPV
jgi:hypothetical protein